MPSVDAKSFVSRKQSTDASAERTAGAGGPHRGRRGEQELELLLDRDGEGVERDRSFVDPPYGISRCELHRVAEACRAPRLGGRASDGGSDRVAGEVRGRREAPLPVDEQAHGQALVFLVDHLTDSLVLDVDALVLAPDDADVPVVDGVGQEREGLLGFGLHRRRSYHTEVALWRKFGYNHRFM